MQIGSKRLQVLSSILAMGNVIIIICIVFWFPRVGFDPFNYVHVRYVVVAEIIAMLIIAIMLVSILRRSGNIPIWISAILQILQVLLAIHAIHFWPGGDDGSSMGWQLFVIPIMGLVALCGLFFCVLSISIKWPSHLSGKWG
jgi:hypothetical protein